MRPLCPFGHLPLGGRTDTRFARKPSPRPSPVFGGGGAGPVQRPGKLGLRFSRKERTPSRKSSLASVARRALRRSWGTCAAVPNSMRSRSTVLWKRCDTGESSAISPARAAVSSARLSGSTTALMKSGGEGLLCRDVASGEEEVTCGAGAGELHSAVDVGVADDDAALGGGEAELGVGGRDADVGVEREFEASAEAVAAYGGDGRFGQGAERLAGGVDGAAVVAGAVGGAAGLLEVLDVGAGGEGLVARAREHDDADGVVRPRPRRAVRGVRATWCGRWRCAAPGG